MYYQNLRKKKKKKERKNNEANIDYGFCLLAFHLQSQHIVQILDDSICNWYKTLC